MAGAVVPIPSFAGGLNLRDAVDAIDPTQCIDCLNVDYTDRGALKRRQGYEKFTTNALTERPNTLSPYYDSDSTTKYLIAGSATRLEAIPTSGGTPTSQTGLTSSTAWSFARFSSPANDTLYAGNGKDFLRGWDGTAWSTVSTSPKASLLASFNYGPLGGRLAAAGFQTGAYGPVISGVAQNTTPSHIWFSDPANPTAWTGTNYVQLRPGDGEKITAVCSFSDGFYVFKETCVFKFYGVSLDSAGEPVFNYITLDQGVGAVGPNAVAAGRDGVYFVDRKGVYRVAGSQIQQVSELIDPIFDASNPPSDYYKGGVMNQEQISKTSCSFFGEQLFVSFPAVQKTGGVTSETSTTNNRTLVYDPRYRWWSLWDTPIAASATFRASGDEAHYFAGASGANHIYRFSPSVHSDNGATYASRWRSGWFDFGQTTQKRLRGQKIWGIGTVFLGVSADYEVNIGVLDEQKMLDTGDVRWNTFNWNIDRWYSSTGLIPKTRRRADRGTVFSTAIQAPTDDEFWAVHRLEHHLPAARRAAPQAPDLIGT